MHFVGFCFGRICEANVGCGLPRQAVKTEKNSGRNVLLSNLKDSLISQNRILWNSQSLSHEP
jgi:hypothetical protein